jgi:hypothetical protein
MATRWSQLEKPLETRGYAANTAVPRSQIHVLTIAENVGQLFVKGKRINEPNITAEEAPKC